MDNITGRELRDLAQKILNQLIKANRRLEELLDLQRSVDKFYPSNDDI